MSALIDTITKAKAQIVLDHPFFASLLLGMRIIEDPTVKTLCVDGEEIRYNPDFMAGQNLPNTVFCFAHETMHCVFEHMHRRGTRDPKKWNIAGDYIINETLINERIGIMPPGCLHNPELVKQGNGTTEGVYNILPDDPNGDGSGQPGAGQPGGSLDEVKDAGPDEATIEQKRAQMSVKIVQAANAAKMQGKLSAGLERLVKEFTRPRADWRAVLRRFFTERAKIDYSFARPKKRFLAEDIILPSLHGEKPGEIVIAVDCSGSINDHILGLFGVECRAIKEDLNPTMVRVIYFDSVVLKMDSFDPDQTLEMSAVGGGGTAFSPIWKYLEEQGIEPMACVVLTDLHCSDFGDAPAYPVLFASNGADAAPFGEIIRIDEE